MRGHDVHGRAEVAVRHRDSRKGGRGERARHTRDDAERHPVFQQIFALLAAAAEQIAVAALETHDVFALLCQPHQNFVDLILRHGMVVILLADVDACGLFRNQTEDVLAHQPVEHDRVRLAERRRAREREQPASARPRADQRYFSCHTVPSACCFSCKASVRPSVSASLRRPVTAPRADRLSSSVTYSPLSRILSPWISA